MSATEKFESGSNGGQAEQVEAGTERGGQSGSKFQADADLSNPSNRGTRAGGGGGDSVPRLELKGGSEEQRGGGGRGEKSTIAEPKSVGGDSGTGRVAPQSGSNNGEITKAAGSGGQSVRNGGGEISKANHGAETSKPADVSARNGGEVRQQAPAAGKQSQEPSTEIKQTGTAGQQAGDKIGGGGTVAPTDSKTERAKVAGEINPAAKAEQNPSSKAPDQTQARVDQNPSAKALEQNPSSKANLPALEIKPEAKQQPELKQQLDAKTAATKPELDVNSKKLNDAKAPEQNAVDATKKANDVHGDQKAAVVQAAAQNDKLAKPVAEQQVNAQKEQTARLDQVAQTANRVQRDQAAAEALNKPNALINEKVLPSVTMTKSAEESADKKKKNEFGEQSNFPMTAGYSAAKNAEAAVRETATATTAKEAQLARTTVDLNAKLDMGKIQPMSVASAAQADRTQAIAKTDSIVKADSTVKVDAIKVDVRRDEQRAIEPGKVASKDGIVAAGKDGALTAKDFTVAGKDFTVGGRVGNIAGKGHEVSNNAPSGDLIVRGGRIAGFAPINAQPGDREGSIRSVNAETGRRYLTGAEIGLLIALAGIAKKRSDDMSAKAESCQKNNSEVEKKAESIKKVEGKANETESKELDLIKRFPAKEITVSAMIAFTGVSKGKDVDYQQVVAQNSLVSTQIERTLGATQRQEKTESKTVQTTATPMTVPYGVISEATSKNKKAKYDGLDLMQLLPTISIAARSRKKSEETEGEDEAIDLNDNSKNASLQDERETHKITSGETLLSIAEKRFGDEKLGWLIADLNANKIKETRLENRRVVEIAVGEKLALPTAKEIRQFHERKDYNVPATHLVTILIERSFDRAFIDEQLGIVFGCQRGAV